MALEPARAAAALEAWERAEAVEALRELAPAAAKAADADPALAAARPADLSDLFTLPTTRAAVEAWRAAPPGDAKAASAVVASSPRLLAARLASGHALRRAHPLRSEAEAAEATLRVALVAEAEGKGPTARVPFGALGHHILGEKHRSARHALAKVQAQALEEHLNPRYARVVEALGDAARDLGFADHAARCDALGDLGVAAMDAGVDDLLRRTEGLWRWNGEGMLGRAVQGMIALSEWHDLARSVAMPWYGDLLPAKDTESALVRVLDGMGLAPDSPGANGLRVHTTPPGPGEQGGALALAPMPPSDVRLLLRPAPGSAALRSALHEAALALQDTCRPAPLGPGDDAVRRAFGILFEDILAEPAWARSALPSQHVDMHGWHQRVLRLMAVRRAAGMMRFEVALHRDGPGKAGAVYKKHLTRALVVAHAPERALLDALADGDEAFDAAVALRGHVLAVALRAEAKQRFGEAWWQQRAAGDWLRGLWQDHAARTTSGLASALGGKPGDGLAGLTDDLVASLREEPRDYQTLPRF